MAVNVRAESVMVGTAAVLTVVWGANRLIRGGSDWQTKQGLEGAADGRGLHRAPW